MSRAKCRWVLLAGLCVLSTGCSSARYVTRNANEGVIAVSSNSDHWPTYNRRKAADLMQLHCPDGYVVEKEEEVVVGQTIRNNTVGFGQAQRIGGRRHPAALAMGLAVTDSEVTPKTEWRITYRRKSPVEGMAQQKAETVRIDPSVQPAGHTAPSTAPSKPMQ